LNSWKHALGQLCAYKLHLTRRKTVLYLYGPVEDSRVIEKATQTCNQYGIVVNYKRCSIPDSRLRSGTIRRSDNPKKNRVADAVATIADDR